MISHILKGIVDHRFIFVGFGHRCLHIVRDDELGQTAKVFKGMDCTGDHRRLGLIQRGLCKGIAACSQSSDKYFDINRFTGILIDDMPAHAGVIHEHLLTGFVADAHGNGDPFFPRPVQIAEMGVPIMGIREEINIFFPEEFSGNVFFFQSKIHFDQVWQPLAQSLLGPLTFLREKCSIYFILTPGLNVVKGHAGIVESRDIIGNRRLGRFHHPLDLS